MTMSAISAVSPNTGQSFINPDAKVQFAGKQNILQQPVADTLEQRSAKNKNRQNILPDMGLLTIPLMLLAFCCSIPLIIAGVAGWKIFKGIKNLVGGGAKA
jgi:hypothetical protein